MAGETQRAHAVKELGGESTVQDEGPALEQQSDKTTKETSEHFSSTDTDARAGGRGPNVEKVKKERDGGQQREAVIRPQQTGKIDFSSLQNRTKFAADRTWSSGKSGPQSPSGKGRSRDKSKRSGKSDRGNPQHLYNLSITNPRSNLNIGIAYPQQKVLPAKKQSSCGYRVHAPGVPEREVDTQQEELSYSRGFQEPSSNLTSPTYTSQSLGSSGGTSSHQHLQQVATMESNSTQPGGQLLLSDFQLSGSNEWQPMDRTFNGANYGVSSQKSTALTQSNKANMFAPGPFHYGYNFLEESASDSFASEQNQPDFTDSSLCSVHVTHNSFSFTHADGQNLAQSSTQFNSEQQPEHRGSYPYTQQFLQGGGASIPCPRSLSEDSASSDSSQQSEQGKAALPESTDAVGQANNRDADVTSGSKRTCHPKDSTSPRSLLQGVHHMRNASQTPVSQLHFLSKSFNSPAVVHSGSVLFDKNNHINNKVLSRLAHPWEGPNKTYSSAEQTTVQYNDINDKFPFQNQPSHDKRANSSKNNRMPWQQIRPTPNRIDLSRSVSNQKLAYMVSPSEWQDDSKSHKTSSVKNPSAFQTGRSNDSFSNQRQETVKHNNVSTFKVEMSSQVCESKGKAMYFGLNPSLPGASTRNYSYPPLQVAPVGLMVSPYESPLPSPVHTPTSGSTCSSLSPASTSPVNIGSEDSQMSKTASSHPFYQQPQAKAPLPADHAHPFPSDSPRNLNFTPGRAKDNLMSYLQNSTPKAPTDGSKGYMDGYELEHHQPPPPYSAHQLFTTSLATANLDQLDVLLTCKQCDQNFNNLASFLGHKQYCSQHAVQNDLKIISKMEDSRKFHAEPGKTSVSMSRCPSDLHLSLLGLNKNGELMSDGETKGDSKDDPMFSGPGPLPVPLPELEMEDAKLDSLITEALNGLGYQSDNVEIDSSFIDAFADDELTTIKSISNKKSKESLMFESKNKQAADDGRSYFYDSDTGSPKMDKHAGNKAEKISLNSEQDENSHIKKDASPKNARSAAREKTRERDGKVKEARNLCKSDNENAGGPRFLLSSKFSERCGVKSFHDSSVHQGSTALHSSDSPSSRTTVKESRRKSSGGGTWSKELIHKIVQQKNKLHKLHVKGTKNLQFSLVMKRLTPTVPNPAFGEYDYVSDSDDECEAVKIASQGRLNQSSRCKYTYTKECKWRARSDRDQAAWRHESKECFQVKKSEGVSLSPDKHGYHQRLRRRGSRSSSSSEHSTSVSVSSDNSPKSAERTDSDCERKADVKKKESTEPRTGSRPSPQKICKESSMLALTFTKSVKKYNQDKPGVCNSKDAAKHPKTDDTNPASSSPKPKDPIKSMERGLNPKPKEELVSNSVETDLPCTNSLESSDNLCPKDEPARHGSTDPTSHSATINKDAHLHTDRNGEDEHRERPPAPQLCTVKEPASLSLMEEVCLSPAESRGPMIQKDSLQLMSYPLDDEQGLIKSPLTFDTSSMFGDLAGFESSLYTDIQKDGFHSMQSTSDKKEEFVSSFSPFLEQREWNIIVSPVLPDEIAQYKGNLDKPDDKKPDYNHVPLTLPEKIIDYSTNLNASEDELEIKRIVNELENQLQTTKLESSPSLNQSEPKQLQMSKFSPLRLGDETESEGAAMRCANRPADTTVSSLSSEPFTEPGFPWSSPFQFELMSSHHSPCTAIDGEPTTLRHFTDKEDDAVDAITTTPYVEPLHNRRYSKDPGSDETKEEFLEQKQYAENLMKSLEVISDSIFKKEPTPSVHTEINVTSPQQHETEAVEREEPRGKEAMTVEEEILSLSERTGQRGEIGFVLSQSSPSDSPEPAVSGNQARPPQPADDGGSKPESKGTEDLVQSPGELLDGEEGDGEEFLKKDEDAEDGASVMGVTGQTDVSAEVHDSSDQWTAKCLDTQSANQHHVTAPSPSNNCVVAQSSGPRADMSAETVSGQIPVDSSTESHRSALTQEQNMLLTDDATVPPMKAPLPPGALHKQEDVLNVQDIKEHLPLDFMASHQDSPSRDEGGGRQWGVPPTHPLSPSSYPMQQPDTEHDPQDARNLSLERGSNEPESLRKADEEVMSPAPLDVGLLPSNAIGHGSSLPVSSAADSLGQRRPLFEFKLSPLYYSAAAHPQLTPCDYIPISPAGKADDTSDVMSEDLSVNPRLIFNKTETAVDKVPVLDFDHATELGSSEEPPAVQDTMKLSCFSLGLSVEPSADDVKEEVSHEPGESIQRLPISPPRTAESADFHSHDSPADSLLRNHVPQPLIACGEEQVSEPQEKHQVTETTRHRSPTKQVIKELAQTRTATNAQQSKVLCDICFMCFRTAPGLKRHKAMKHSVRAEKQSSPQITASLHQGTALIYEALQTAEKEHQRDSQGNQSKTEELSENPGSRTANAAETALEETATDERGLQTTLLPDKVKKNNKAKKKNSEGNLKLDPFSDELLQLLKTDILQALTPEYKSDGLQEPIKPPHPLSTTSGCDSTSAFTTIETDRRDTEETNPLSDAEDRKCMSLNEGQNGETCTSDDVQRPVPVERDGVNQHDASMSTPHAAQETGEGSEQQLGQQILQKVAGEIKSEEPGDTVPPPSRVALSPLSPPGISPDLKALLEDDTIFSQLFPRDEEAKRKKCPRVYSKRNKRQKVDSNEPRDAAPPSAENGVQNPVQFTQKPTVNPTNPCEYETISIDDTLMLNISHHGALKPDERKRSDQTDGQESDDENSADKPPMKLSSDPSACKAEEPHSPRAPPSYTLDPCTVDATQNLHSIDIQNINTTFQLPEIQLFDSCRDISVAPPPPATVDVEPRGEDKSKNPVERRGRKRLDGGLKVKDKQYKCKACFTWFLTLGELNFHKLSHNPSPPPTCYMCVQRKFSSREQLRDHLREKHAKNKTGIWTCGMCLKEISDVWMYNEHLREHATQFARRGQTQVSMLDIPGCFMQETAVKNFITSIMQHRPSRASRESSKAAKDPDKPAAAAAESAAGERSVSEGAESKPHKTKSSVGNGGRQSTEEPRTIEVLHKTETPKSLEIHPNCQDPSRDCHHCGKRFPKPFKLQRHLVVHNLEKIFLCPKCPVSYQEPQDLKDHLKRAHEEVEELDSKHTTLYTCELCADVMHVIKKSFICSTCNYTFSKKEQFDRHMEKHLSGGNEIFKFRAVLRPVRAPASTDDECDPPAGKKRRMFSDSLQENSCDGSITSLNSLPLNQTNSDTACVRLSAATLDDSTQTTAAEYHGDTHCRSVKTEDIAEDYSELLVELEKCIHMSSSEAAAPKEEEDLDGPASPPPHSGGSVQSAADLCDVKEEDESVCIRVETTSWSDDSVEEIIRATDVTGETKDGRSPPASQVAFPLGADDPTKPPTNKTSSKHPTEDADGHVNLLHLGVKNCSTREPPPPFKVPPNTSRDHRDSPRAQKKRKDMKSSHSLQRLSSPATQENYGVDAKAKKNHRPSKCGDPSLQRQADGPNDYPVLASVRDDAASNKIVSKCKSSALGSVQLKRSLLNCSPKKADTAEYKAKKGPVGRALHTSISKVSTLPISNSVNKSRPKPGVRSVEGHSYRTAESQNHLLSQLFGPKLTSFKIPLRKDTSESIN